LSKHDQTAPNDAQLFLGDCEDVLESIEDASVQLVVSSPPYNIGKEYESDRRMSLDEYLHWLDPIIGKLCDKISESGSICWQVGSYVSKGEVFPLDYYFFPCFAKRGFKLRNRIVWRYNFGLHATKRFSGRYETLLWLTKSSNYKFNLDPVRVPQLYPGKRHSAQKGEKAGKPSGNPLGKNPSDYWEFSGSDAFLNEPIWDIPNVKSNHPEKTPHPCQFPIELAERCILAFSDGGDRVLDPFMGVGTTVVAALKQRRIGIGIEKDPMYMAMAKDRISAFREGALPIRRGGQKPRRPKPTEKVATVPDDWTNRTMSD
jgi:DNA modification methylase